MFFDFCGILYCVIKLVPMFT